MEFLSPTIYAELLQSVQSLKGPLQVSPFANGAVDR